MSSKGQSEPKRTRSRLGKVLSLLFKIMAPIVVLIIAGLGTRQMLETAPKAPRQPRPRMARLVEVTRVESGTHRVTLEAMGEVIPARRVELKPEVTGRVIWIAPTLEPGARFRAGEPLLKIEDRDFKLAVTQRKSELDQAKAAVVEGRYSLTKARTALKLEMGNQAVALKEYKVLNEHIDEESSELVLRKPQLRAARGAVEAAQAAIKSAEAALEAARARLAQARLDLERTTVFAPFNMIVKEKWVDVGDMVATNTPLMEIIGSDTFWVKLAVPQTDLGWVKIPEKGGSGGSPVRVFVATTGDKTPFQKGRVIRRLPAVEEQGRMAQLLVAVDDPLGLNNSRKKVPPLLLGTYVRGEIRGESVESAVAVPRDLVRNGNQVWVMTDAGTLDMRTVEVIHRGRDVILVRDELGSQEQLIVTDLAAPVQGMPLRVEEPEIEGGSGQKRKGP